MREKLHGDTISVLNELENLPLISDFINRQMLKHGLDEAKIFDVRVAVDEVCTNIIQYAYPQGQEGIIHITCVMEGSHFVVIIEDNGQPFDPLQVSDPRVEGELEERELGGLGVYFMKQLIDELKYEYREEDGSESLTMIKYV